MSCPHRFTEMVTAAHVDGMCPLCMAARIERLEAAHKQIADLPPGSKGAYTKFASAQEIARAALAGKEGT